MAWSVPIWKVYGFSKASFYLERFVLKHATAHIHQRYRQAWDDRKLTEKLLELKRKFTSLTKKIYNDRRQS